MSMLCTIFRVSSDHLAALGNDPGLVDELLDDRPPTAPASGGVVSRLFGPRKSPGTPAPPRRVDALGPEDRFELDQAWHILHYLLTGVAEGGSPPAAFICAGGTEVGRDLGYGPPRLFGSREAREIAEFLARQSLETLSARYAPEQIERAEIYWQASPSERERAEELRGLAETLHALQRFLAEAARAEGGFLVEIY